MSPPKPFFDKPFVDKPYSDKPFVELELRPVAAPSCATAGARVFMLLPTLDELLGATAFGEPRPILLAEQNGRHGGWRLWPDAPRRRGALH